MSYILQHRVGTYVARDDIRAAKKSVYTFDKNEAMIFATTEDAQRWERINLAHSGIVELVEVAIEPDRIP